MTSLQVAVRPTLVPLTVDAIPDSALPYASLSKLLSASEWDKLCRTTARAANYRCCPPHNKMRMGSNYMLTLLSFRQRWALAT